MAFKGHSICFLRALTCVKRVLLRTLISEYLGYKANGGLQEKSSRICQNCSTWNIFILLSLVTILLLNYQQGFENKSEISHLRWGQLPSARRTKGFGFPAFARPPHGRRAVPSPLRVKIAFLTPTRKNRSLPPQEAEFASWGPRSLGTPNP
jgi:hypothetical protein